MTKENVEKLGYVETLTFEADFKSKEEQY